MWSMLLIFEPLVISELGGFGNYRPRLGEMFECLSGEREEDLTRSGDP
jgi:hypothetical protein